MGKVGYLMGISWIGALIALGIAITLILFKVPVFFGMMTGAFLGGVIGFVIWMLMGNNNSDINQKWSQIIEIPVNAMFNGGKDMGTIILRILASGILSGALIYTNASKQIALKMMKLMGTRFVLLGLILTSLVLTASGVFIDIAVITMAPIAISVAKESKLSRQAILIALIGGGKAGNLMSPNPNAIAVSESFDVALIKVMGAGALIAIVGVLVTFLIVNFKNRGDKKKNKDFIGKNEYVSESSQKNLNLPGFFVSILGPLIAIIILIVRPMSYAINDQYEVIIDPLIALPVGGIITILVCGFKKDMLKIMAFGLQKVIPVAIILAGTGMLSGIISASDLSSTLTRAFEALKIPSWILAPFSGIVFAAAVASTTAGSSIASKAFAPTIGMGIQGAAMTHAGATVLDSLPHGSFFHATAGSVRMSTKNRLKIILYESLIGLSLTISSTIIFGIIGWSF